MSILLDPTMDQTWYGDPTRAYYTDQATLRATNIRGRSGTGRYLVAGHGYGHLVNALRNAGNTETWGVDLSDHALTQSKAAYPAIAARFVKGDCRSSTSMASVRTATAGGPSNRLFNVIVSEDLLSACGPNKHPRDYTPQEWTDANAEALSVCTALRSVLAANGVRVHVISMLEPDFITFDNVTNGLWHTGEEWRALLPATDKIVRLRDLVEF
jgi:hypothetical protein